MHEADLSMIKDVERRAVRKWEKKNNVKSMATVTPRSRWADRFEYKDMIKDFWWNLLPD
jgi:isochorismate hydrolase